MTGPRGAHIHFSSERCNDFSCLVQSYFDLNVSVQKVHWKMRFLSSVSLRVGAARTSVKTSVLSNVQCRRRGNVRGAARFRLLLSLLPARLELKEPKDPRDCEEWLEKWALLDADRDEVSRDVDEAALTFEKPEPALERFFLRPSVEGEVDTSSSGSAGRERYQYVSHLVEGLRESYYVP